MTIPNTTKPKFILLVGMPASGKSSFAVNTHNTVVLSTDNYLEKIAKEKGLTINEVYADHIKDAQRDLNITFEAAMAARKDIVWDQTNLNSKTRRKRLCRVSKDYHIICIYFTCPWETLLDRNKERRAIGKNLSYTRLKEMMSYYEVPTATEGFHEVFEICS